MIDHLLVYDRYRVYIDMKSEKKSEIDIFYPIINYFDVVLDKIYLSIDIFYPKSTE